MMRKIENIVCIGEGINPADIHCKSRRDELKECRQIIMYFTKKMMPSKSWSEISGYFDLDHSTAMHAYKTIQNYIDTNREFRERMKIHEKRLKAITIDKMVVNAEDTFRPLEFEIMKLEKKISDLRGMLEAIKIELELIK